MPKNKKKENINLIAHKINKFISFGKHDKIKNSKIVLKIIKKNLIKYKKKIIESIKLDVGKSAVDSSKEFEGSLEILDYVIKNIKFIEQTKITIKSKKKIGRINYVPIGVVGIITPWNYPLLTLFERLPFCIGSGSGAIIKLSEHTPIFSNLMRSIFNKQKKIRKIIYITANNRTVTGKILCEDPNISLISFVGSSSTAKKILSQSASSLKKTNLELGGKNPAIVTKTANIKLSVSNIINGIFENSGQACVGISRVIIHEKVYNLFITSLLREINLLKSKNILSLQLPANKIQRQSTLTTLSHVKKNYKLNIIKIFNFGLKNFTPIFLKLKNKDKYFLENEFFFPIITFEKFKTIKNCVDLANCTDYGLACYVFSNNKNENKFFLNNLHFGRIWINSSMQWHPSLPVGGFKSSGGGRDMGLEGFKNYMTTKSIYTNK